MIEIGKKHSEVLHLKISYHFSFLLPLSVTAQSSFLIESMLAWCCHSKYNGLVPNKLFSYPSICIFTIPNDSINLELSLKFETYWWKVGWNICHFQFFYQHQWLNNFFALHSNHKQKNRIVAILVTKRPLISTHVIWSS